MAKGLIYLFILFFQDFLGQRPKWQYGESPNPEQTLQLHNKKVDKRLMAKILAINQRGSDTNVMTKSCIQSGNI